MEFQIQQTAVFERWLLSLRDLRARIAIARRIDRATQRQDIQVAKTLMQEYRS